MSLLIYSPRCKHSMDVIEYINKVPQLKQLVHYHNINTQGIPPNYRNKINRVPTMLTKNGKILVGNDVHVLRSLLRLFFNHSKTLLKPLLTSYFKMHLRFWLR